MVPSGLHIGYKDVNFNKGHTVDTFFGGRRFASYYEAEEQEKKKVVNTVRSLGPPSEPRSNTFDNSRKPALSSKPSTTSGTNKLGALLADVDKHRPSTLGSKVPTPRTPVAPKNTHSLQQFYFAMPAVPKTSPAYTIQRNDAAGDKRTFNGYSVDCMYTAITGSIHEQHGYQANCLRKANLTRRTSTRE